MSSERHTPPESHTRRETVHEETDVSAGWKAEYLAAAVELPYYDEPTIEAATRADRPSRYRRKHAHGVSS